MAFGYKDAISMEPNSMKLRIPQEAAQSSFSCLSATLLGSDRKIKSLTLLALL